jgi:hypothetical protein
VPDEGIVYIDCNTVLELLSKEPFFKKFINGSNAHDTHGYRFVKISIFVKTKSITDAKNVNVEINTTIFLYFTDKYKNAKNAIRMELIKPDLP